jgi:hypothetical protein
MMEEKAGCMLQPASLLTSSDVNATSGGSPDRPFVLDSGKALYLASTMPYMLDTLPPALTVRKLSTELLSSKL